ncbi:MAG: hypothetical protein ABW098_17540 [Candidatus Thiodiazotropha sp.]
MKNTTTITIDLAKDVFQVAVFNKFGKKLTNKAMNSKRLVQLVLQHPESCIYMLFFQVTVAFFNEAVPITFFFGHNKPNR